MVFSLEIGLNILEVINLNKKSETPGFQSLWTDELHWKIFQKI